MSAAPPARVSIVRCLGAAMTRAIPSVMSATSSANGTAPLRGMIVFST